MKTNIRDELAEVVFRVFVSPNIPDQNGEPSTVVDGLFAIAGAINRLALLLCETPMHDDYRTTFSRFFGTARSTANPSQTEPARRPAEEPK